ncbi:MAG: hypothetical protein AAFO89_12845, partial [Planctomycetota bacterium]
MNLLNSIRVATIGAGLLAAAGLAQPLQAQTETETVRERVVVTLPNGKRIVRMVERQVPVTRPATPAPAAPAPEADPFAVPEGDTDGSGGDGGSNARNSEAEIDPRIVEWIGWYRSSDMRADANGDGRVTAADFNAFLQLMNGDDDTSKDGGDAGDAGDGGDTKDNGNDDTTDDGSDDGAGDGDDGSDGSDGGDAGSDGVDTSDAFWTELTPSSDSLVFYVAESGSDSNDGLSPNRPLRTVSEG